MVFGTDPHLQRARKLSESDNAVSLRYACLELRFALERIAYQKLQLRLDKVAFEEISGWQPRRVMDCLMDLVDEHLAGDSVIRIARDKHGPPSDADFTTIGTTKGVKPRDLGKHWQKLSSFLHAEMPKKKGDHPKEPNPQVLRAYLQEVISYIEQITSTRFDAHFAMVVTFRCDDCDQSIVRNATLLKPGDLVRCQNPNCTAAYIAHKEGDKFHFAPYDFAYHCTACKTRNTVTPNPLLTLKTHEMFTTACAMCAAEHDINWVLQVSPKPKSEVSAES